MMNYLDRQVALRQPEDGIGEWKVESEVSIIPNMAIPHVDLSP